MSSRAALTLACSRGGVTLHRRRAAAAAAAGPRTRRRHHSPAALRVQPRVRYRRPQPLMLHFMSGVVRLVVRLAGFVNAVLSFSLPLHNGREHVAEWERDLREERDAWPKAAQPFRVLRAAHARRPGVSKAAMHTGRLVENACAPSCDSACARRPCWHSGGCSPDSGTDSAATDPLLPGSDRPSWPFALPHGAVGVWAGACAAGSRAQRQRRPMEYRPQ